MLEFNKLAGVGNRMDLGSIFLILALSILVSLFIGRPLLDQRAVGTPLIEDGLELKVNRERSALLAEQERILNILQELDFDRAIGKIQEKEYLVRRLSYLQSGVSVLQRLDAISRSMTGNTVSRDEATRQMEAAIEVRRAGSELANEREISIMSGEDSLENLIAARRRTRLERSGGFCTTCGRPLQKSDRFCFHCGTKKNL